MLEIAPLNSNHIRDGTEAFEKDLKGNLYKIWNRMSSGSYFPPAVRAVSIPKKNGGQRILGVPTVADRVAQTVVKLQIDLHSRKPSFLTPIAIGLENPRWMPLDRRAIACRFTRKSDKPNSPAGNSIRQLNQIGGGFFTAIDSAALLPAAFFSRLFSMRSGT